MSYPNFGLLKTIVLPIPNNETLSRSQYKEKYGIDLADIFKIENGEILFREEMQNAIILFSGKGYLQQDFSCGTLLHITDFNMQHKYEAGVYSAVTGISYAGTSNGGWYFGLSIDKDDELSLDNLFVYSSEL